LNHKDISSIGLHLRLKDSVVQLIEEARMYDIKYFQFFLLSSHSKNNKTKYVKLSQEDCKKFIALKKQFFKHVFIHSSYWINPATGRKLSFDISKQLLKKEIAIAQKLDIHNLVLHPGSATWHRATPDDPTCKHQGIDRLASMLNALHKNMLKSSCDVQIILENTAHANRSIGSDLYDFVLLKEKLDYPEKLGFCVDFSHAFAYGYNLRQTENFIATLEKTMGLKNIKLIHLNDSAESFGSKKDKHAMPGKGCIGKKILQVLVTHPKFTNIPKIIEPPVSSHKRILHMLKDIYSW